MKNMKIIGLVVVLALLFTACDKDNVLENKEVSGKEVAVRIRSMNVAEGASESLTRSALQKMVSQPIGDGMLLEMSVKEDVSPLRDKVELAPGTHFRVIAVTDGTKYYSHGDYVYGSGTLTPSNDFHVKIGQTYHFICISYNSSTLPSSSDYTVDSNLPTAFSVDKTKDLLWWHSTSAETITASGIDLDIILKQKLAKVKVKIDCDYNKWKIGVGDDKVSIKDVALSDKMNLLTGDVAGEAADTQLFSSFTATENATSQTSNELRIMPKASSTITVTVLEKAVSRDGVVTAFPSADKQVTLTTPLIIGTSYTITIRLRVPIFARSNIYWDATAEKLTFVTAKEPPTIDDDTKAGYQGVFFKWGSLVGISPVGNFSGSTDIYVPVVKSSLPASTWKATTGNAMAANNTDFPTVSSNWTTWTEISSSSDAPDTDIPYMDRRYAKAGETTYGRSNTYVIDAALNLDTTYQGFRGDICQYLGKTQAALSGYRLPTSYEFGSNSDTSWGAPNLNGWQINTAFPAANISAGYVDGTADLLDDADGKNGGKKVYGSAINKTMRDVVFPASGYREPTAGATTGVGSLSFYWSGAAHNATYGCDLYFQSGYINPGDAFHRSFAFPIRCVKN
jgi:hypothetical protein